MFLVTLSQSGPRWDYAQPLEGQSMWAAHAEFMDALVDRGFVVLGGPLNDARVVLAVAAASAEQIRETLAQDPWSGSHLHLEAIEPWTIRLDGTRRASA